MQNGGWLYGLMNVRWRAPEHVGKASGEVRPKWGSAFVNNQAAASAGGAGRRPRVRDAEGRPKGGSRRRRDGAPANPGAARPLVGAGF